MSTQRDPHRAETNPEKSAVPAPPAREATTQRDPHRAQTNPTFRTGIGVRLDDVDTNWHVRGPALLAYADHARWECVRAAGVNLPDLTAHRIGPVNLETTIRFLHELRPGERVEVSCAFGYGAGKTSRVFQELRTPDGTLIAEVSSVSGMLDLDRRRLVADPGSRWRAIATDPSLLGL